MLNKLLLASLAALPALTATASAQPAPHPQRGCAHGLTMPDDRCAPTGAPLFDIEVVATKTHAKITSSKLYANGAWTFQDFSKKTPATATGYLDERGLKDVKADLARAPWKHFYTQPPCRTPETSTELSTNGKVVWIDPTCGDNLDEVSRDVLVHVRKIVGDAIHPQTARSCAPAGTPLVELAERERTFAVYRNGAWALDTRAGGTTTHKEKCLAKDVLAAIEADVAAASWTISHPIHCMIASSERTIVKIDGVVVFTERVCNPDQLDDTSARMLADIERLMEVTVARAPACAPRGTPLVELDFEDVRVHSAQRTVTLWNTSAWTMDETIDGKSTKHAAGCLAGDALATIEAAVKVPWQIDHQGTTCRAFSSRSTVVKINGKQVFVERICSDTLDAASAKSLAEIEKLLAAATKAP